MLDMKKVRLYLLPLKVFINFIFIMHPGFSVDKELQEGKDEHEGEGQQRHWAERGADRITRVRQDNGP